MESLYSSCSTQIRQVLQKKGNCPAEVISVYLVQMTAIIFGM